MSERTPQVSVVIPAYNQAQYLSGAIESVLAQTYQDYEIIVVNDGSTDNTAEVATRFEPDIRYIYQKNQGLAGARNTGIRHARGQYIALLDSDDLWLPTFLEEMMALAAANPDAAVFYGGMHYIDANGSPLSQQGGIKSTPPEEMYRTLLRANHLVPSATMLKRSIVVEAGLFDIAFRRLQDWELWIRLLRQGQTFIGLDQCLLQYRIHGESLSIDPSGGQKAARMVVEKHFGLDDEKYEDWPADKRRAYGGLYRYCALSSVQRQNNWQAGAQHARRAFQSDPSLAEDLNFFYDLALGAQPPGHRGGSFQLNLEQNAAHIEQILADVFDPSADSQLQSARCQAYGAAYHALGLVAYNTGQLSLARRFLLKAIDFKPALWRNRQVVGNIAKSLMGQNVLDRLRRLHAKGEL